jgi:hypothetical protein
VDLLYIIIRRFLHHHNLILNFSSCIVRFSFVVYSQNHVWVAETSQ